MALSSVVFQSGDPMLWSAVGGCGSCVSLPASGWLSIIPGAAARAAQCCGSLLKAPLPIDSFSKVNNCCVC